MLDLVARLPRADVEFALCGGLAMAVHARPRATLDMELLVPVSQLATAKELAQELG